MNNYPAWWDQTLTLYNKSEDPSTHRITWYRTVLRNCFWKDTGNKIVLGETSIDTNSTICRVPVNNNFREKFLWDSLESTSKASTFTFGIGDIIIKGNVTDIIDEYTSGQRSSDLLSKYNRLQGAIVITRCTINTGTGRGNEHYYVKGV